MNGFGNKFKNENKSSNKVKPSKEQIFQQAVKFHTQGNIQEAAKYYQYLISFL